MSKIIFIHVNLGTHKAKEIRELIQQEKVQVLNSGVASF